MTAKELKEALFGVPDDALIFVESDHGQSPEQAASLAFCAVRDMAKPPEDLPWSEEGVPETATGVLIS